MAVTGFSAWWIAVLIGGNKFVYKRIERDDDIIQNLIKIESDFWNNHVLKQVPPSPDGSPASTELVKELYPKSNGLEVDLPSSVERWIQQYEQASEEEKLAVERKEEAANNIKMLLGEYEAGRFRDWKITWRPVSSSRLDTKRLKAEFPDIYEQFLHQTTSRRFGIKRLEA
jgi:predicted phage-related endonuclease